MNHEVGQITTEEKLLAMLNSSDPMVRRQAAESTHATENVLIKAIRDGSRIPAGAKMPEYKGTGYFDPVAELCCQFDDVSYAAAANPNATDAVLLEALTKGHQVALAATENINVSSAVLLEAVRNGIFYVAANAAYSKNATEAVLRTAMGRLDDEKEDFHIRWFAVRNENTPIDILTRALDDPNDAVRGLARKRLAEMVVAA